jgi:glutathione synthase
VNHIFFVDPLEKLNLKKDSSLMMALSFQQKGHDVYLLFEKDFAVSNQGQQTLDLYPITGSFKADGHYIDQVQLSAVVQKPITKDEIIHMRIDPPFDSRYQRYLWMLDFLSHQTGCRVINNPIGIMQFNEKLTAYKRPLSLVSLVGSSLTRFKSFVLDLQSKGVDDLILKPLDLYSGIGVEKINITDPNLFARFEQKVKDFEGAIIAQPFQKEVYQGEIRSLYFFGQEVGSILKKPVGGDFLANIAQGAQFEPIELSASIKKECDEVAFQLLEKGIYIIAYDILGKAITEINVTCPGLFVEVSYAHKKNLASTFVDLYHDYFHSK